MSSTGLRIETVSGESARMPRFEPLQSRLPEPGQAGNQPGPVAESREQRRRGHYALRIGDRELTVRVSDKAPVAKGEPSAWEPGEYRIAAKIIVLSAGSINTP